MAAQRPDRPHRQPPNRPTGSRRTTSMRSRRCSAPSWSTTTPITGSRTSSRPTHFVEDLHRRIYEVATSLIKAGKVATPITIKTFLGDQDLGGRHGLAISRPPRRGSDHGHQRGRLRSRDLRPRHPAAPDRHRRGHGQRAYDAPVESSPRDQIEEAERRLYELAETGRYDGGFQRFYGGAHRRDRHGGRGLQARAASSRASRPACIDLDRMLGGLQPSDLVDPRRPPGHGQDRARHQHRLQHRQGLRGREAAGRDDEDRQRRHRRASSRSKCRPSSSPPASSPSRRACPPTRSAAATSREQDFYKITEAAREMQTIPFYIDQTGGISIAQLAARARRLKRQRGLDLLVDRLSPAPLAARPRRARTASRS